MPIPIVIGATIVRVAVPLAKRLISRGLAKKATSEVVKKEVKESGKTLPMAGKQKVQTLIKKAAQGSKDKPVSNIGAAARRKARRTTQVKKDKAKRTTQVKKDKADQQKIADRIGQKKIAENIGKSRVPAKRNEMVVRKGTELTKPKSPSRPKSRPTPQAKNLINRQTLTALEGVSKDMKPTSDEKKQKTTPPKKTKPIKKPAPISPPKKTKPQKTKPEKDPTEGGRYAFYPGQTSKDLGLMYEVDKNKMPDEIRKRLEEAELYEGDFKGGRVGKGKKKKISKAPRGVRAAMRGFKTMKADGKVGKQSKSKINRWV